NELFDLGGGGGGEHGFGPVDVVRQHALPRRFGSWVASEVDHVLDVDHRLGHRVAVGDVGDDVFVVDFARQRFAIQQPPVVGVTEPFEDRLPHPSGRAGE